MPVAMMMTEPQAAVTGEGPRGLGEDIAALFTLDLRAEPTADLVGYADTDGNCTDNGCTDTCGDCD
jgi:hypothetical protein